MLRNSTRSTPRHLALVALAAPTLLVALSAFAAGCAGLPPEEIPVRYDPDSTHPQTDRFIGERLDDLRVPGIAALAARDGALVYEGYFGYANRDTRAPVTASTAFNVASVSKIVAAAALFRVWEDGLVALDQDVSEYIDFEVVHPSAPDEPITLRQLVTHTSGIADNWSVIDALVVDGDSPIALGDFLEGYLVEGGRWYSRRRNFGDDPGEWFDYSNVGSSLAAYVAGEADGRGFLELCKAEVFEPLGLQSASWLLADADLDTLASPHEIVRRRYEPLEHYGYPDYPDGGLRITGRDLMTFLLAHRNADALFTDATLDEVFRVQAPDLDSEQALGWANYSDLGPTVFGHDGGDFGVAAVAVVDLETGDAAVLLMNGDWYDEDLVDEIIEHLLRGELR